MRLVSVSVRGFRSIADVECLAVGRPTLLTGHNDAGKSALLDATRFLLGDYIPNERDLTFDSSGVGDTPRVGELVVTGEFDLSTLEMSELDLPPTLHIRRRFLHGTSTGHEIEVDSPTDERLRNFDAQTVAALKDLARELKLPTGARLKKAELVDILREHALTTPQVRTWSPAPPAVVKALPAVERFDPASARHADDAIKKALDTAFRGHIASESHREAISELERAIEQRLVEDAREITNHIVARCADIGDVRIIPIVSFSEGLRSTQVTVIARSGDGGVGLGEAGAGRARRVSLAVWEFTTGLLTGAGDVVMIYDEPDTHLDYAHQREFMEIVKSQCELENVTMLIATHSMNLIDGIDIANVVHVSHDDESRTRVDILTDGSDVGRHLGAIAASLGLRNTVLLHERLFVGVEGPTETGCFPVLFQLATGQQLESAGIALWGCRNNEGALDFAAFLVEHGRNVAFVVDEDSRRNAKHVFSESKLTRRGLDPGRHALYVGEPMELEELFADELWVRVANNKWPRVDGREWSAEDFSQHRRGKFSKEVLDMVRTASESGPSSKPDVMIEMALSLTSRDEVPEPLRLIFSELVDRAR